MVCENHRTLRLAPAPTRGNFLRFGQQEQDPAWARGLNSLKVQFTESLRQIPPRVWFLGVNHRRAPLSDLHVRLALAQAVDRKGLLERHFRSDVPGSEPATVNGLFPRGVN